MVFGSLQEFAGFVDDVARFQLDVLNVFQVLSHVCEKVNREGDVAQDVVLENDGDLDGLIERFEMAVDFTEASSPPTKKGGRVITAEAPRASARAAV